MMSWLPVLDHALFIVLSALRKELGGGVGGDPRPQAEDALPLLDLLPTQEPAHRETISTPGLIWSSSMDAR